MIGAGVANYHASPRTEPAGSSVLDQISIANLVSSAPVCIQQYVSLDESRSINCNNGDGRILDILSTGIVASGTDSKSLTQCPNT